MSAQDPQVVGEEAFEDDELDYEVEEEYSGDEELIDDDAAVLGQQEGLVDEEYDSEEGEEIDEDADDEEDQPGAAGGGGGGAPGAPGEQMLYIPGLGYIPLSNFPGLGGAGRGAGGPAAAPPNPEGEREWSGLREFPGATQEGLLNAVNALKQDGRTEMTLLVLGKGGVGKSSTINSLLNERVANVTAFQQDVAKPTQYSRRAAGFTLHCIDTPSVLDQDNVSDAKLEAIGKAVKGQRVDAVLYLDRLDSYKLDTLDRKVIEGISRVLGPRVWDNAVLGFTRASESSAPGGLDFATHVEQRAAALRAAINKAGGAGDELAVALIENSSRCPTNEEGEKVVPGEVPWIVDLVEKLAEVALNLDPFSYDPKAAAKASNPNRRRKWLIPLVLAAQVAMKLLLDRVLDEDGCRGDANGPFDEQTVEERREELKRDKEERRRKAEKKKQRAAAASAADDDDAGSRYLDVADTESDLEDDDF